jgi:hypothetical protein
MTLTAYHSANRFNKRETCIARQGDGKRRGGSGMAPTYHTAPPQRASRAGLLGEAAAQPASRAGSPKAR